MSGSKIFIAYSKDDQEDLERLRKHLRPLERDGRIEWWADTKLEAGDRWRDEIDEALASANAAILLISSSFLATDFVVERELPALLAKEQANALRLLCVFLSPAANAATEITYLDSLTGEPRSVLLTDFQGYGRPDMTLKEMSWPDRERTYEKLVTDLSQSVGLPPSQRAAARVPAFPRTTAVQPVASASQREFVLTVELERRDASLVLHYRLPGFDAFTSAAVSWPDVESGLAPIEKLLDGSGSLRQKLVKDGLELGQALFQILFGPQIRWEPILRQVYGLKSDDRPTPLHEGIRLRLCTDDARLLSLPWRLVSWQQRYLAEERWTIEVTGVADPTLDPSTTAPSGVLLLIPEQDDLLPGHAQAVEDLLKRVWPLRDAGFLRRVRTAAELEQALAGLQPHLLYVYANAKDAPGGPVLCLDGDGLNGAAMPLRKLPEVFQQARHTPDVVYLNIAGAVDFQSPTPGQHLGPDVPLVLWRRLPDWTPDSPHCALAWLSAWLGEAEDPVEALHQVSREGACAEIAALVAHGSYRSWKTARFLDVPQVGPLHLKLDRDQPKAEIAKHVLELVRSDSRRLIAVVGYGDTGNAMTSLGQQLLYYLESTLGDNAAIRRVQQTLPADGTNLRTDLEHELKLQLGCGDGERIPHLLRRHGPRVGIGRPVLWLEWGVLPPSTDFESGQEQVMEWLKFCSHFLSHHCPDDLRIVTLLPLELAEDLHGSMEAKIDDLHEEPWASRAEFWFSPLPAVGHLLRRDLINFLRDTENTNCPANIHVRVARALHAKTGGVFEATIALMEEAERTSWYDLLERLESANA